MKLTSFDGKPAEVKCLGCEREAGNITQGNIITTEHFDAHQDFEVPIPGFIIVSSRRHIRSVADFSDAEMNEFLPLIIQLRKAMLSELRVTDVYLIQNEDTRHHFHLWLFPRLDWMEKMGRKIASVQPIMDYARKELKTKENLARVEDALVKIRKAVSDKP